jgi:hypothetical protein
MSMIAPEVCRDKAVEVDRGGDPQREVAARE